MGARQKLSHSMQSGEEINSMQPSIGKKIYRWEIMDSKT